MMPSTTAAGSNMVICMFGNDLNCRGVKSYNVKTCLVL